MSTRQERAERRMARKNENSNGVENAPAKKRSVMKTGDTKPKSVPVAAVHKNGALKPLPILMNKIGPTVADVRTRLVIGSSIRENVGIATASTLPVNSPLKLSTPSSAACHGIDFNARENVRIKTEPILPVSLYSQLKALGERGGFITNTEDFECVICFTMIEIGDGVRLRECLHQFCYDCLKNAIMLSDEAEVPCPFGDGASKCDAPLLESEIRAILSANEYDNYLKRSLRIAEGTIQNTVHCKLADCDGWCICEDNVNQFACPKCKSVNCVSCQVSVAILHAHHRRLRSYSPFLLDSRQSTLVSIANNIRRNSNMKEWVITSALRSISMTWLRKSGRWSVPNARFVGRSDRLDTRRNNRLHFFFSFFSTCAFADCDYETRWMWLGAMFDVPNGNMLGHEASSLGSERSRRYIRRMSLHGQR